jgi:hypothetical protein
VSRDRRTSAALGRLVVAAVAVAGGLALATSGVALAAAFTRHGPEAAPPSQALLATHAVASVALVAESDRLGEVLASTYPSTFGGVAIEDNDARISVYMTQMPRGLTKVVDAVTPPGTVAFNHSMHSLATLLKIHRDLARDWLNLQSQGIDIVGFGPDVATSTEQIQVISPTLAQVETLVGLFGSRTVSIDSVGEAPIPESYTLRVESEFHSGVPRDALPILAGIEAATVALVGFVVIYARRRRRRAAA